MPMFEANVTYNGRHLDSFKLDNETEFGARISASVLLGDRIVISIHDLSEEDGDA